MKRKIGSSKLKETLIASFSLFVLSNYALGMTNPTSGRLVLINSLGNVVNGSPGGTASAVTVVVSDSTGPCSTTTSLAYQSVLTVNWDSNKTHSTTQCTGITSVNVTAIKTLASGFVQYNSTATTPAATAAGPTNFVAPLTPIANVVLIVTGNGGGALTSSATSWGAGAGSSPTYASNGTLSTSGVMSGNGIIGLRAAKIMLTHNISPATDN